MPFLIVKDFWLQPQCTSEPRTLSVSHHSCCRVLVETKEKTQDRCDVPDGYDQKHETDGSDMATVSCMFGRGRASNPWQKHFLLVGTRIRKELVVDKGTILQEKVPLPMDTLLRGKKPMWIFTISAICCVHKNWFQPRVSEWFPQSPRSPWRLHIKSNIGSSSSAPASAICADQWLPGPWPSEYWSL